MSTSTIALNGNLAFDPELRFTPSGVAVAELVVLENRRTKRNGEWIDDEPNRFIVTVWREQAENAAESLRKGSEVIVIGEFRTDTWEDNEGQTRFKQYIEASHIGAGLRFQTAKISRTSRRAEGNGESAGQGGPQEPGDPWAVPTQG